MHRSLHIPVAPGRELGAWVCLVAVLFLRAPLRALALQAKWHGLLRRPFLRGSWAPENRKPAAVQPKPAEAPMECEYHGAAAKNHSGANCSISCCHQQEVFPASAAFFVPAPPCTFSKPAEMKAPGICLAPASFAPSPEPLSPPPRFLSPRCKPRYPCTWATPPLNCAGKLNGDGVRHNRLGQSPG